MVASQLLLLLLLLANGSAYAYLQSQKHPFVVSTKSRQRSSSLIRTSAVNTASEELFNGMRAQSDSKKFVAMLKSAVHRRDFVLSASDKTLLIAEINFRHNQLDFSSLTECLSLLGKMGIRSDDKALSSLITDIMDTLASISPLQSTSSGSRETVNGVTGISMTRLLNALVRNGGSWGDLPLSARELLLSRIRTSVFNEPVSTALLPDVAWSLGKLRAELRSLDPAFLLDLMTAISGIGERPAQSSKQSSQSFDVAKLLYGLSQMKTRWVSDVSDPAKSAMIALLGHQSDCMNENGIVNSVYSLGKMECPWMSLSENIQRSILLNVERVSSVMGAPALANTLWGLGRMEAAWKHLAPEARDALLAQLLSISPLGPHSASMAFTGLSKMRATWTSLPPAARRALEDSIPVQGQATEQVVANMVHSMGCMGAVHATDLSSDSQDRLAAAVIAIAPTFTDQGLSNTLYGLARMGFRFEDWSRALQLALEAALFGTRPSSVLHMKDQSISNSVWSLGHGGALWSVEGDDDLLNRVNGGKKFRLGAKNCFQLSKAVARNAPAMTEQGLSNTLFGLAKMRAQWSTLDVKLRSSLSEVVVSRSPQLTQQGLSNTLWALQEMGVVLYPASVPVSLEGRSRIKDTEFSRMRESLSSATLRLAHVLSAQSYSTIVYSMAMMGCQYTALEHSSRTALESACSRVGPAMGPKEISLALYGLGKMNMLLRSVSSSTRSTLLTAVAEHCSGMDEQELGNTVWALSHVGHSVTEESGRVLLSRVVEMQQDLQWQSLLAILQGIGSTYIGPTDDADADADDLTRERTRTRWSELSVSLQDALLGTLTRLLGQDGTNVCKSKMAGTALYWLGRLQTSYFGLPVSLRSQLIAQVSSPNSLTAKSTVRDKVEQNGRAGTGSGAGHPVVLAMNGIASMGATWGLLEAEDRELLERAVAWCLSLQQQDTGTAAAARVRASASAGERGDGAAAVLVPGDVSSLLWSLGRMGLQIGSLSSPSPLIAALSSSDPVAEVDSEKGAARAGVAAAVILSDPTQQRGNALELNLLNALEVTVSGMSAYEVAWCMWALARMGLTFSDLIASKRPLGSLLLVVINKHIVNMAERELGIVLWAVGRLQYPVNDFPLVLRETLFQGIETMVAMKISQGQGAGGGKRRNPNPT